MRGARRIRAILISYEIVWAILRNAPNSEYLLLEAHPLNRVVYTFILETDKNRSAPHLRKAGEAEKGYKIHMNRAKNRPMAGAAINGSMLANDGFDISFTNSLIASAKGWGIPVILTLLGPLRNWMYPRYLRSKRVKNAIAIRAHTRVIRVEIIEGIIIIVRDNSFLGLKSNALFCHYNGLSINDTWFDCNSSALR